MADDPVVPLRLPGSPSGTHVDHLRLEDALNALGQQDYPAEWGRLPGWSQMPFRWLSRSRQYVRHELRQFGRRARLQRMPVAHELTLAEKRACIELYKRLRGTVREALEQGKLHAHAVHHATGEVASITAPGIWRKQAGPIFFTGRTVLREPDQADRLADVVLERKPFERWLADRARAQAKMASVKMLQDAGAVIATHGRQHEYEISRSEAIKVVVETAREHDKAVSVRQFNAHVWKSQGATAGRRMKEQRARAKQFEADLRAQLAIVFGGASGT